MAEVQLLCEGSCNGNRIALIDRAIHKAREAELPVPSSVYAGCVYTPHRWSYGAFYKCQHCGQERRWGVA